MKFIHVHFAQFFKKRRKYSSPYWFLAVALLFSFSNQKLGGFNYNQNVKWDSRGQKNVSITFCELKTK